MKLLPLWLYLLFFPILSQAQAPPAWNSAEIGLRLKKLDVLGSVLYIAAHPDDENTRLLGFLAKGKLYRTGYLSLTRGDGGQNLIGDEQGIELGLIRTQELLAARRVDGAEQFFSRAYDFGFSKSTDEALRLWDREKVLSDAVWVIRKFKPDVIIARFPPDSRAGHGQHSASAVIANEAYVAAADPSRFPEQLNNGVEVWQAKRLLWNTFNFGTTNTTAENQLKFEVGGFEPLLGKSFGEIAAESRSQHKSQGFGVPAQRGSALEYFQPVAGPEPSQDLMDGVVTNWNRLEGGPELGAEVQQIIREYDYAQPGRSVKALVHLYQGIAGLKDGYWKKQKLGEVQQLIEQCGALFMEAWTPQEYAVQGDSIQVNLFINNRSGMNAVLERISMESYDSILKQTLALNRNLAFPRMIPVSQSKPIGQPYWLVDKMVDASYTVKDQQLIGLPGNPPSYQVSFFTAIEGVPFRFDKPLMYKHTDPVKGELYQPICVVPPVSIKTSPGVLLFRKDQQVTNEVKFKVKAFRSIPASSALVSYRTSKYNRSIVEDTVFQLSKGVSRTWVLPVSGKDLGNADRDELKTSFQYRSGFEDRASMFDLSQINYDHIPSIRYFYEDEVKLLNLDLKVSGKKVGYIKGAGDKVPEALELMGFQVTQLGEKDMNAAALKEFDAIVTGVRAYNVQPWLDAAYDVLMDYISKGGNYVVQYNTPTSSGNAHIGPYDFTISRNRVTDEKAEVTMLDSKDRLLNWPNLITAQDFNGWIQERGIYFSDQQASPYKRPLSLKDPGEKEQLGSLISCDFGKGRFIYTGLVFFRELPAAVGGAYRLFANLVSNPNSKINGNK